MIQFYAPDIESTRTLPESDSGHAVRVLRLQAGDEITVVDGLGTRYGCVILEAHPKHVSVEIISREKVDSYWHGRIVLAVSPVKNNDRTEWFLEKAVEMGVDEIVMLRCRRSERKEINRERFLKIMVSAMKQSLKAKLPMLSEMTTLADFLKDDTLPKQRFVGYCDANTERREFARELDPMSDVVVMIGPEGDFSPEEIAAVKDAGFVPVTFGDCRLRTETAAMFAVAAVHALQQKEGGGAPLC